MDKRSRLLAGALSVGLALAGSALAAEKAAHWSYEGAESPEHWGDLEAAYATCKLGHRQSPIDIPAATLKAQALDPIRFDYKASPLRITDNGHTVMVTFAPGSKIRIGPAEYELRQLHFHDPSEEKIDGKSFPMVAHLVHENKDGRLAVVAVLFKEGPANPVLGSIFGHLPAERNKEEAPAGVTIDASGLLPVRRSYWTFQGSLTTPPCSEGVTWYVLQVPATEAAEQIGAFATHYAHNARPVQPIGDREIRASE